ncbi:ankyrin repeat-containing domain protein [Schizophyllum commune]
MLLTSLPRSLEEMYAQRLNSIIPQLQQKVKILLAWLVYHGRPISLDDFARLQAFVHPTQKCCMPIYDASLEPSPKAAVAAIDTTFIHVYNNTVSVAHASVKDFILNLPISSSFCLRHQDAALMARMGLAYTAFVAKSASADCDSCLLKDWATSISLAEDDHYPDLVQDVRGVMEKIRDHPLAQGILRSNICTAIMLGHDQLVDLLLHLGANIELVDDDGWPLLHQAAKHGHLNVCRVLISRGADLNTPDSGLSPMHVAAQAGHAHVLEYLLDINPSVHIDKQAGDGTNSLYLAAVWGHLEVVTLLLSRGANVNGIDRSLWERPLDGAARKGHLRIVELFLSQPGVDVEGDWGRGQTTLHHAIAGGAFCMSTISREATIDREEDCSRSSFFSEPLNEIRGAFNPYIDTVRLLLDQPTVNIDAIDLEGVTALHVAADWGSCEYIALLLARGATANAQVASGPAGPFQEERRTPLHVAAARGNVDAVTLLLDYPGVSVNERAVDHRTALHFAIMERGFNTVASLLDRGADIDAVTTSRVLVPQKPDASEPGHQASGAPSMQLGSTSCIEADRTYLQRFHMINMRGGLTPLHLASMRPCVRSIRVLCENGANMESRDEAGWSPLYCAAYCGNEDSVRVLLECGADAGTRADDGLDLLCQINRWHFVQEDAATYERIRGMLLQV